MYIQSKVNEFYNQYGIKEWNRLDTNAYERINYYLHLHFIKDYIKPGMRILDAGCGAGKFSVEFLKMDCKVTLLDLSETQLEIAKSKIEELDLTKNVEGYIQADLCDLSQLTSDTYDVVVCYGAPLNYLFKNDQIAMNELVRVTKPNGNVFVSVNSKWGVMRAMLDRMDNPVDFFGKPDYWYIEHVATTGDLMEHESVNHPPRHFYNALELEELLVNAHLTNVRLGASPCLTSGFRNQCELLEQDPIALNTILQLEEQTYTQRTMVDQGEFLLAHGRK